VRASSNGRRERRIIANAAQLSLRDLRLRPLRPEALVPVPLAEPSPLEAALIAYVESLP
jgi:hypothetical protein